MRAPPRITRHRSALSSRNSGQWCHPSRCFIGLALGPYTIGQLSDAFGDLRTAMMAGLLANAAAAALLLLGVRRLAADEASLLDRARAAGEPEL